MKLIYNYLIVLLLLSPLFTSCRKETFDPHKYDDLLYVTPPVVVERFNSFTSKVDGSKLEAPGVATVDSSRINIKGSVNGKMLTFSLPDFRTRSSYNYTTSSQDSSVYTNGSNVYTTRNDKARGEVTIAALDTVKKYIEGTFSFTLLDSHGDSVRIEEGYFKISYVENNMQATVNYQPWSADTVMLKLDTNNTVVTTDDKFVVTGINNSGTAVSEIKLVFPKDFTTGTYTLNQKGKFTSYYTSDINAAPFQCDNDAHNKITLNMDPATRTIEASFIFQTEDGDLIEKGKFTISY